MSRNYNVVLNIEALEALPRSGKRRELVLSFIKDLAWSSHIGGDVSFQDELSLRPYEMNVVAGYAITWWIDAPVNEIRVVDIRPSS